MLNANLSNNSYIIDEADKSKYSEIEGEVLETGIKDQRLRIRLKKIIKQLWNKVGNTIPFACQDWSNTKAAYRFLSNENISEDKILYGHFQTTKARVSECKDKYILILQDTTEFSYQRKDQTSIGITKLVPSGRDIFGKPKTCKKCGILMHSSLATTTNGLPLGLTAVKFWTRAKFKGTNALKKKINPTRIPIEKKESFRWLENLKNSDKLIESPQRCVHIGDRENDIYEFFCMAADLKTNFLVRTCVDRLAKDGKCTVSSEMATVKVRGKHKVLIEDLNRQEIEVLIELKYEKILILPPIGKHKKYPKLQLTVIHAEEKNTPVNREKIVWKLITNLDISSEQEAIEKLDWYTMRWKIETFHKILKSGCKAENLKLRTADRITNMLAILCIISWRIFWITMINRCAPQAPAQLAFTDIEIQIINCMANCHNNKKSTNDLSFYIEELAKLGGYLARKSDPPPGITVIWRGLKRLSDIEVGANLKRQ